jgi:hypothetical protein
VNIGDGVFNGTVLACVVTFWVCDVGAVLSVMGITTTAR